MQEFTEGSNVASRARWIHSNPEVNSNQDENGGGIPGHGSCMLTRAAGHTFGIAKHVSPVIVRTPRNNIEYYLSGLRRINDDVGDGKRAVLLMSLYWPRFKDGEGNTQVPLWENDDGSDGYDRIRETMLALLKELSRKGLTVVTGSGNANLVSQLKSSQATPNMFVLCERLSAVVQPRIKVPLTAPFLQQKLDGLPATLADRTAADNNRFDELIVLGATNHEGTERWVRMFGEVAAAGSNRDDAKGLPHLYAPGWDVQCTERTRSSEYGHDKYRLSSGTSDGESW